MACDAHETLTDGIIFLRPLLASDASDHLAGEDDAMARWLSGGHSTSDTVRAFIEQCQEHWRTGGSRRAFGVFDCSTNHLIGLVEANLALLSNPGEVNISLGIFRDWRGRGLAIRAIDLMASYLRTSTNCQEMVLRIAPSNVSSLRVAAKAGFSFRGLFDEPEGPLMRYSRPLVDFTRAQSDWR